MQKAHGLDLADARPALAALSVTMKFSIIIASAILTSIFGFWIVDIARDRTKTVKITHVVSAYNDWECGYQNQDNCKVLFETQLGSVYKVQRIRYGKDFMAIEITQERGQVGF